MWLARTPATCEREWLKRIPSMSEKEDDLITGLTNRLVDAGRVHWEVVVGGFGVLEHL